MDLIVLGIYKIPARNSFRHSDSRNGSECHKSEFVLKRVTDLILRKVRKKARSTGRNGIARIGRISTFRLRSTFIRQQGFPSSFHPYLESLSAPEFTPNHLPHKFTSTTVHPHKHPPDRAVVYSFACLVVVSSPSSRQGPLVGRCILFPSHLH